MSRGRIYLKSRYGDLHSLVPVDEIGENAYKFVPAKEWMPVRYLFNTLDEEKDENDLIAVDTDGGPFVTVGDEIDGKAVKRIYVKKGYGPIVELS